MRRLPSESQSAAPKTPTTSTKTSGAFPGGAHFGFITLLAVLVFVVGLLFRESFKPEMAMFANDGPLGLVSAACNRLPGAWTGIWANLNWLGLNSGSTPFDLTAVLAWALGPLSFIKFYPAITITILGISAWLFFRQLNFHPAVCVLGGIAAALNTDFFSYACWGLGTLTLCVASVFLALAALSSSLRPAWIRPVLAGLAVGNALLEGFDNGAIFSLYVAAFAMVQAWVLWKETPVARRLARGAVVTAGVAVTSALVAAHILLSLVNFGIRDVAGMGQDEQSKAERWSFVTQWSLPPKETLRAIIPGLYGYRMDTAEGGLYWGRVGQNPAWDTYWQSEVRNPEQAPRAWPIRYSGAGHYAGVLVVVLAIFALAQSFRRPGAGAAFTEMERRWVWFWGAISLLSLLFAFGRFAPFYRLVFALPYFNTIRNPVKFLHPFNLGLVILFAYGAQALWRGWIDKATWRAGGLTEALGASWKSAARWERRWTVGSVVVVVGALIAWFVYGSTPMRDRLATYLTEVGSLLARNGEGGWDAGVARMIAGFSVKEVGLFVLVLAASAGLVVVALSGWLAGGRRRLAGWAFVILLTLDLARANVPWILHYNWRDQYATNPVFDILRERPHEARVTGRLPFDFSQLPRDAAMLLQSFGQLYGGEWLQYQFQFYNIQSLDIIQMPRPPADVSAYTSVVGRHPLRQWELSNTRYLLTLAPLVEAMNQQLDPGQRRFRVHTSFSLSQTPEGRIGVTTNTTGPFGIIEFTGALPRAMLFDQWRSNVPDEEALGLLVSTNFQPSAEVLIAEQIPAPAVSTTTQPAGTATYEHYDPKRVVIATDARTPCVLLVNDKHDSNWRVFVDGKEEPLLRANFIVRGVYLAPGKHQVEFRFEPPVTSFWVSVVALFAGLGLCGFAIWNHRRHADPEA